eukprot:9436604-Heterocapsa_arctica.AAC.1
MSAASHGSISRRHPWSNTWLTLIAFFETPSGRCGAVDPPGWANAAWRSRSACTGGGAVRSTTSMPCRLRM